MKNKIYIPPNLKALAQKLSAPLYVVGGYVRNSLLNLPGGDIDIASTLTPTNIKKALVNSEFTVANSNLRVGTVIIKGENLNYEYTTFREDNYPANGTHTPSYVSFTNDIMRDASRRDFKVNAIYYDILNEEIVDPLNGLNDLKNKVLSTTVSPTKVFSEDGLRIMRLCRFAAELGFNIEENTFKAAKELHTQIKDLSVERIAVELKKIITADERYGNIDGHFKGINLLNDIGALDLIFPQLKMGKNFKQNEKYHLYDVFTHSLLAYKFSPPQIRLAALLHDIAKPICQLKDGNMYNHAEVGSEMVKSILGKNGLKFSNDEVDFNCKLILNHMYNLANETKEYKLKLFIAKNYDIILDITALMKADSLAAMGHESQGAKRIEQVYDKMLKSNTPMKVSDLYVNGQDLIKLNVEAKHRSKVLNKLLEQTIKFDLTSHDMQMSKLKEIIKQLGD